MTSRRVRKFQREMRQVSGFIGAPPPDAPGVPDMVEVRPGVWVRSPGRRRASNAHIPYARDVPIDLETTIKHTLIKGLGLAREDLDDASALELFLGDLYNTRGDD